MLDVLNEDCVRLVLRYVSIRDIVRAERVSRAWQEVVLRYLRSIHIQIQPAFSYSEDTRIKCRMLYVPELYLGELSPANLLRKILPKLGKYVVGCFSLSTETLSVVTQYCPNLIHLGFIGYGDVGFVAHWLKDRVLDTIKISQLKQISFRYQFRVTDETMSRFLTSEVLEELVICSNDMVTGSFLTDLKSPNMKSLGLMYCKKFEHQYLLSALDKLTDLTTLDLRCDKKTFENVHLILDRMPKLEELTLHVNEKVDVNGNVAECLGRLSCLRLLDLASNPNVSDEWLHAVARGCKQLESLNVDKCKELTARSVAAVCRTAGLKFKWLSITGVSAIEYENVLEFIEFCPKLEVRWTSLTAGRRVVRARADTWVASREQPEAQYPGLTVEFYSGDEERDYEDRTFDEDIESDDSDDSDSSNDGSARE